MRNILMNILSRILSETRIFKTGVVASRMRSAARQAISICITSLFRIPLMQSWKAYCRSWRSSMAAIVTGIKRARLYLTGKERDFDTVMTQEMERKYWKSAAKDRMTLLRSDARFVGTGRHHAGMMPPIILSYTPALPPVKYKKRKNYDQYFISTRNYCKWHRMVFPGESNHPTIDEASRLRSTHDPDELRQIHHISCMLRDDQVFPNSDGVTKPWSPKYQKIWKEWLSSRDAGTLSFSDESTNPPPLRRRQKSSNSRRFAQTSSDLCGTLLD